MWGFPLPGFKNQIIAHISGPLDLYPTDIMKGIFSFRGLQAALRVKVLSSGSSGLRFEDDVTV